jgi:hypothetical protein
MPGFLPTVTVYQCREDEPGDARDMDPKHPVSASWVVIASAVTPAPSGAGVAAGLAASGTFAVAAA